MQLIILVIVAFIFGAMLFFTAVVTPVLFKKLGRDAASKPIRTLFPAYYFVLGSAALAAAVLYAVEFSWASLNANLLAAVAAGFFLGRFFILPRIEASRPPPGGQSREFRRLHRLSVVVNLVQLLVVIYVLLSLPAAAG